MTGNRRSVPDDASALSHADVSEWKRFVTDYLTLLERQAPSSSDIDREKPHRDAVGHQEAKYRADVTSTLHEGGSFDDRLQRWTTN